MCSDEKKNAISSSKMMLMHMDLNKWHGVMFGLSLQFLYFDLLLTEAVQKN